MGNASSGKTRLKYGLTEFLSGDSIRSFLIIGKNITLIPVKALEDYFLI